MSDNAVVNLTLPVSTETRDAIARIAAARTRETGQKVSVAGLLREALVSHLGIDVPAATHHRRPVRHRA